MKKRELEIILERVEDIEQPEVESEQYATPAPVAAELLFFAFSHGDIADRVVYDLGCGNGILGIGAKLLGARAVIGIDRDGKALGTARKNSAMFGVEVDFRQCEIHEIKVAGDTVVMNPPFGAQRKNRHADRAFLEKALVVAPVVYSIHNAGSEAFIRRLLPATTTIDRFPVAFPLKRRFAFHQKDRKVIPVDIYRIARPGE
ncbi:MAG TPA: methyltransferase domain-containing protein [Methanomicrobia archaeon]|nr:methyltransferase domain-containing protein [Methanomicrobia archaeon]